MKKNYPPRRTEQIWYEVYEIGTDETHTLSIAESIEQARADRKKFEEQGINCGIETNLGEVVC